MRFLRTVVYVMKIREGLGIRDMNTVMTFHQTKWLEHLERNLET
jgi:hypothetical protein